MKVSSKIILSMIIFFIFSIPVYSARFPYPIIFVHGLAGSDETFLTTMQYLSDSYDLGPIYVFDMILNADNDMSKSNLADDVRWEDFTYDGILSNPVIKLGRRTFAEDYNDVSDGWDSTIPSQLFAVNFREERIRGASKLNDLFDQSNQAAIFKQGYALSIMIKEVIEFTGAEKVILIGHSMGGLAIREYLQRTDQNGNHQWWINPDNSWGHQVAKVITIGTPHLGSNAGCDPTKSDRTKSVKPDFNGTSEAMRDLKYSFESYPNCDLMNPIGIYLFGGNEYCLKNTLFDHAFNNIDINCNASDEDFIIGINKGTTDNPDMPLPLNIQYTWIISDVGLGENPTCLNVAAVICSGTCEEENEPPGDGSVLLERQWLYSDDNTSVPYGVSTKILTHSKHNEEGSDYSAIIKALDEPNDTNLAYLLELNKTISGVISSQPDNESPDIDIYRIENPFSAYPSKFILTIDCNQQVVQEVSIIDHLGDTLLGNSIYAFPYCMTFYAEPEDNIYIKIKGNPFDESWKYPYTINLTRNIVEMTANFEADQTNGKAPFTVHFSDFSTSQHTSISSWQWNFGDGTTSQEKNPQHTYLTSGIYKVSLKIHDINNFQDVETKYNYIVVQSDQIITSDINIVAIEYFFDTDPGFENGISLPVSPANHVSIKTTLDVSHLSPGLHRLYVRAKDENGLWGILQSRPVVITQDIQSNDDPISEISKISHVEYFFDDAPGFGNGNSFTFPADSEITIKETINTSNLDPGLHRLYIRAQDETGTWGIVQSRPVLITQKIETNYGQNPILSTITQIEYFFDEPPGFGNGNSFSINENSQVNIFETINISNLDPGLHRLYIRAKDETGTWGIVQSRPVFITNQIESVENSVVSQLKITDIEYFFDTPPGFGNGTALSFTSYSQISLNEIVEVTHLSPGLHRIYVRALDELGQWGIVQSRPVLITRELLPEESVNYGKVTDIEYFFDHTTDFGNGRHLSFISDSFISLNETIDTSELSPGLHRLYVRAKDEFDQWGIVQSRPVLIESVDESLPDIVNIEYFFNTDPGQGLGSNIQFNPSPYIHIQTNVPINHLPEGDHRIYVRAQDANNAWSQTQFSNFSIIDSPPIIANTIQDMVVLSNSKNQTIDLSNVFKDPDDIHAQFHFSIENNTYPELVSSTINDHILTLSYPSGQTGESVIVILAESDGVQISCSFTVKVNPVDMTLFAINALSGDVISHAASVTAPFNIRFHVAGDIIYLAKSYQWDIDNDGQIDRQTYDNEMAYTFRNEGDYTTKVIALLPDGSIYHQSVSFSVLPASTVLDYIEFVPWYPFRNDIASEIMIGGKAVRCYQTFDHEQNPIQNKKLYYQFNTTDSVFVSEIDNNGFVYIESPETYENSYYEVIVTNKTGEDHTIQSKYSPSFQVYIKEREMVEEYTLLLGMGGSIGIGAGTQVGPIQLKLAKLGFYGGRNISNTMEIHTIGETSDLLIENSFGLELKAELSIPIFENAWKVPVTPELSLGAGLEGQVKQALTTTYRFNEFFDKPDNNKLLAAAAVFMESALNAQNFVGKDRLLSAIINKIGHVDNFNESCGAEIGLSGKSEIGLNLKLSNLIGIPGNELDIDIASFSGEYVYELADKKDISGDVHTTQTVSGSLNVNALDVKLSQEFSGDARQKNGPRFSVNPKTGSSLNIDGEKRIRLIVTPEGEKTLEFKQLTYRNTDVDFFKSLVYEQYLNFQITTPVVINEMANQSQLVYNMLNGQNFLIFPDAYNQASDAIISIRSGDIQWETLTRETKKISIPFDFEIGEGILLGLHLQIDAISVLEFTAKNGILSPEKGFINTAIYDKDDWIANHIKGPKAVLDEYLQALNTIIANVLDTIEQTVELGKEIIVQTSHAIIDGGAQLKAKADAFIENSKIFISKLSPLHPGYRVRVKNLKTAETYIATTVGDVYVVNVQDESGQLVPYYSTPMELTIGYSDDILSAAGFSNGIAPKLNIYRWDGEQSCYLFLGGIVDLDQQAVSVAINIPGQYILAIDETAPEIASFKVSDHSSTPVLTYELVDNFSGIDFSSITFSLDQTEYVHSTNYTDFFNPSTGLLTYPVQDDLSNGVHMVTITAGDTAGNVQIKAYTFTVNDFPPSIEHTPLTQTVSGKPLTITATVLDNDPIAGVFLYYRPKMNEMEYLVQEMSMDTSGYYSTTISDRYCTSSGIRYYIKAIDDMANETITNHMDVLIDDQTGPKLSGDIDITAQSGQLLAQWDKPLDMDLSGYYVYLGYDINHLERYKDNASANYIYLESIDSETYIAICAYDQSGNIGNQIVEFIKKPKISLIPDQTILETSETYSIPFTITSGIINEDLTITADSSNLTLIHPDHMLIIQTGSAYDLMLTPTHDTCGSSFITVKANNQFLTSATAFELTVTCIEAPPMNGDVTGDKRITIEDVILMLKKLVEFSF